jgi:hypothetical protein
MVNRAGDRHRHLGCGPAGRGIRSRCCQRRPDARRLGRHVAAEHHLRRRLIPHREPRLGRLIGRQALTGLTLARGYDTAVWWTAGIFASGAVIAGALVRPGPLDQQGTPSQAHGKAPTAQATAGPAPPGRWQRVAGTSTCMAVGGRSVLRCSGRANHRDPVTPPHLPGGKSGRGPPPGRNAQQRIDRASPPGALPGECQPKGDPL